MGSEHRFVVRTHDGEYLKELETWESIQYGRFLNNVGWFMIVLQAEGSADLPDVDRLIEFWRKPEGGEERLEMVGFCRYWDWFEAGAGNDRLRIGGEDQMGLLLRRIIAYNAETAGSEKTDEADDLLKAIVRENMGSLAPLDEAGRPRAYPASHFDVMGDLADAPEVTRSFAWRNVMDVLQEIAESSRDQGTPLYFDVEPTGEGTFEFRTWVNVRGIDRTVTNGLIPLVFSQAAGNLTDPFLREDWRDEWNYIYGGGQGVGEDRVIDPEKDLFRNARSIWARRENFQDAREEDTILGVANRAFERLQKERPVVEFRAELLDTPQARYGIDWSLGDKVTADYRGRQFDLTIRNVQFSLNAEGAESLSVITEVDRATG